MKRLRVPRDPFVQAVLLGLAAFVGLWAAADYSLWEWEAINFLFNIYEGGRSTILFGRAGYTYFFHALWLLAQACGVTDFHYGFRPAIMVINCALAGVLTGTVYWIVDYLSGVAVFSLLVGVLFVASNALLDTALSYHGDMLMSVCIALSYAFAIHAHAPGKRKFLWAAAFFFGYAVCVREAALLFAGFFPLAYWALDTGRRYPLKEYLPPVLAAATLGAAPVAYFLLTDRAAYLADIRVSMAESNYYPLREFHWNLARMLRKNFLQPAFLAVPLLWGAWLAHSRASQLGRNNRRKSLVTAAVIALPCVATLLITNGAVPDWGRYFIVGSVLWAYYLAAFIYFAGRWLAARAGARAAVIFMIGAAGLLAWTHDRGYFQLRRRGVAQSQGMERMFVKIAPYLDQNPAYLMGYHAAIIHYRLRTSGRPAHIIFSGWAWPAANLKQAIQAHLDAGRFVLYDPPGPWWSNERADIEKVLPEFENLPQPDGMVILRRKTDHP